MSKRNFLLVATDAAAKNIFLNVGTHMHEGYIAPDVRAGSMEDSISSVHTRKMSVFADYLGESAGIGRSEAQ